MPISIPAYDAAHTGGLDTQTVLSGMKIPVVRIDIHHGRLYRE
jgi:hypothetical protein